MNTTWTPIRVPHGATYAVFDRLTDGDDCPATAWFYRTPGHCAVRGSAIALTIPPLESDVMASNS